ncbi:MAG: UDP-N-acetylmuramoyl-L-alanyl-D-glutamate--2,6-diaminopimelate ligase [Spirochaetes bacterium]|nr:UDP-N-acetylmuramoyl-L-alanyl-D-glutamate--2,6-diaminopimelate ligase [Spirochaetota bacterium]
MHVETKNIAIEKIIGECKSIVLVSGSPRLPILSIEYDSRKVRNRSLFVAIEGFSSDGHLFVKDAIARGATAVVVSKERAREFSHFGGENLAVLAADNTRNALSKISAMYYGHPSRSLKVVGITGTNGKTSTTYMLESIAKVAGLCPAVIGTVEYRWKGRREVSSNTTPESRDLQELIWRMQKDGVDCLFMEVSSHALELSRVDDVQFDVAAFTNLTRDHLDFHGDFSRYFAAKKRIFALLDESTKEEKAGIVNIDDPYGKEIFAKRNQFASRLYGIGIDPSSDFRIVEESIVNSISNIAYDVVLPDGKMKISLSLGGRFNVYNSLTALAAAYCLNISRDAIAEGLSLLSNVPGRFEQIPSKLGFHVVVDYAHTDDALRKLLLSVRELRPSRIITVFGCGGNRDKSKRPLMGKVATELSDIVIITSDNPRREDPHAIIHDIVGGAIGGKYEIEVDRKKAIELAINIAREGDIVVIAGKGHEDYQIVGDEKRHFDDREIARECIAMRENR